MNERGADPVPIEEEKNMTLSRHHDCTSRPTLTFRVLQELQGLPILT